MAIDTSKITDRRTLHFETLDEIVADVETLAKGQVRQLGNWSLGQICHHLAQGMILSIDLTNDHTNWPWWARLLGPLFKRHVLKRGLRPGFRLSGKSAELLEPSSADTEDGLHKLKRAVQRLKRESQRLPGHPVWGRFTKEQWDTYHMRHSEMHLSFIMPELADQ